ncbi:MAG TPA: hypothetical protein VF823_08385, partial [Anaerolineales bacterium]
HLNRTWTFFLEVFVLVHGTLVAVIQGSGMWPMFAFGFGAMIVLTQMYGLGLGTWTKRFIAAGFVVLAVVAYAVMGRLASIHEILRIPLLDYVVIFLLYGIFMAGLGVSRWIRRHPRDTAAAATELDG